MTDAAAEIVAKLFGKLKGASSAKIVHTAGVEMRIMRVFQRPRERCFSALQAPVPCSQIWLSMGPHGQNLRATTSENASMLGPQVIIKYDSQLRPSHMYIQSRYSDTFQTVMKENGINVERVRDDRNRECFKLLNPSQGEAAEAACALWQELGYFRHREQLTVSPA